MGGDSCSDGGGFESQHHTLVGHFLTYICCKIVMFVKKTKNLSEKEAGDAPY